MMHLSFSVSSPGMITFFFFLLIPCASPLYFNLTNIGPNNTRGFINITGDANITEQGIQLTPDTDYQHNASWKVSRATYGLFKPQHLWDRGTGRLTDFNVNFSFLLARSSLLKYLAEGLAFFLAPNGSNIPQNALGGRLGLTNTKEANPFVAVVFDTYRNDPWESNNTFQYVGININHSTSLVFKPWYNNVTFGITNDVWISYDSSSQNLSVVYTRVTDDSTVEKHDDLGYVVDLRDVLPEWVTFGFSASTGDLFEKNSIKSWEFNSTFPKV